MFKYRIVSRKDPPTKVKKYYAQGVVIPHFLGGVAIRPWDPHGKTPHHRPKNRSRITV